MLTESEVIAVTRNEVNEAMGYDADVLASIRERALQYYQGAMAAAPEGRSQIVSHDVADCVHSLQAQISRSFRSSILEFTPDSEEDEPQAQLESDLTRDMLEKCSGVDTLAEASHDALLIGNGYLKVFVEEEQQVTSETYPKLSPEQLLLVQEPDQLNQTVDVTETDDGYSLRRVTTVRELKVETRSPDVMLFSSDQGQFRFQELRFVGERVLYTTSQLIAMGVSEEDATSIPVTDNSYWPASRARLGPYQDGTGEHTANQTAEQLHECYDCYIRIDLHGNGESELRNVLYGGEVLISNEPAECIPYATGSPVPMPHRVAGQGMYELMHQIQNAKTATLRNFMDNLTVLNGSRLGVVEGKVNMKDAVSARLNGLIRMKSADAIVPLPAADIGGQAIQGLNYLDQIRSARGGASVDLGDADRQLMKASATAAAGAMESQEKMAGWYCANLVNTLLKNVHMLIHKKLRLEMGGEMGAKLRGKWVKTDPSTWKDRKHITVLVGMTSSERASRIQGLTMLMQQQLAWVDQGYEGIITDRGKVFNTASDWIRAHDLGLIDEYLTDPDSPEAQEAAQRLSETTEQQQAAAKEERDQIIKIEAAKVAQKKYEIDKEIKFKYDELGVETEIEEAKLTTEAVTKLRIADQGDADEKGAGKTGT